MKRLALSMVLLILASTILSCGGSATTQQPQANVQPTAVPNAPEPTAAPNAPEPTAAPAEPAQIKGEITIWAWTSALRDTIKASGVFTDFQVAYPDVKINVTYYSPADLYTNLPLALSAGQGAPDVVLVENSHQAEYVDMGGLLDLTDRVKPYVDKMNAYKWYDCEKDGRYYCMPWDSGPVVLYYRRDVFEKAGLPSDPESVGKLVATWDDYLNLCKTIKEKTGLYCFAHNRANNYARLYEMVLWERGLGYYDANTGEITVDSPENVATLEMLGKFWEADLTSDSLEWTDPWYNEFSSLDAPVATLVEASWMEVFLKSWIAPGTAGLWGVTYMPAWEAGGVRAANDGGSGFMIPAQTKNPDAAWAFIEYVLGREQNQLRMFAVSGFIPSMETTYGDALFQQGDDFFAGQNARTLYTDVVKQIPRATVYGPHYVMMNGSVNVAIQRYASGEATAEEALKAAAEEIRANLP